MGTQAISGVTHHASRITHHVSRFVVAGLAALALVVPAWADVAPPEQPPGSNISPEGQTQVVMSAERVVIEVQPSDNSAVGIVTGTFRMHNAGSADEQMKVRFPLSDPSGYGSGFFTFPTVEGFAVEMGGKVLPTTVITTSNPLLSQGETEPIKWAAFDVNFPAGNDTEIIVTYKIEATGYPPSARFSYVLETGAGWKDAIGSVDIVLRLPYAASSENVSYTDSTRGGQMVGNEVRWHWNDLEPTSKDNPSVTILAPKAWQAILDARAVVAAKPNDASALVALARAYDKAITSKFPLDQHDQFATKSEETYSLALVADPQSAAIHAEYARSIWSHMTVEASITPEDPNLRRVLAEISQARSLDPQNAEAQALLAEVVPAVQGTVVVPTAVKFEPPPPTPIPTEVAMPTAVSTPLVEVSPGIAPTITILPPVPTISAPPTPTVTIISPSSGGTSNVLLVVGIVALPVIAALATFMIVSRRRAR